MDKSDFNYTVTNTMNSSNSISVIIPTYNRCQFIVDAIESVLKQDIEKYQIEIIVIDDGSVDNTKEVLKKYIDPGRTQYYWQKNCGAGYSRNIGISKAKGDWITFLDSDDVWLSSHLSIQFAVIEKLPLCKVIFTDFYISSNGLRWDVKGLDFWAEYFNGKGKGKWKEIFSNKISSKEINLTYNDKLFSIYSGNIFREILFQACMPCWTTLISKDVLLSDIRFKENMPTWEDFWFSCKLTEYNQIFFADIITAENRGHQGPRLTQADLLTRTKCYLEICSKIYMRSVCNNRPSDQELAGLFIKLNKILFKEYLKKGMKQDANKIRYKLNEMGIGLSGYVFIIYYLASFIPFNIIPLLVKVKNKIIYLLSFKSN